MVANGEALTHCLVCGTAAPEPEPEQVVEAIPAQTPAVVADKSVVGYVEVGAVSEKNDMTDIYTVHSAVIEPVNGAGYS
jgi:hypothetical protein